jgi:hypothetical protein
MSKSKVNMSNCAVCTETYNKSNRKEVTCPSCNFSSCRTCYTTYWNNSIKQGNIKLRCLSGHCDYVFDPDDMIQKKTFTIKDIKQLQSDIRAEKIKDDDRRELSMITEQDIARVKEALLCRRFIDIITNEISRRGEPVVYSRYGFLKYVSPGTKFLYHLRKTYNNISSYQRNPGDLAHMALFLNDNPEYITQYMTPELYARLVLGQNHNVVNNVDNIHDGNANDEIKVQDIPVANCSVGECRGFIRTFGFQCNICSTKFCNKCMMVKQDNHVCDEKNIASFQLIKKECKPCPSCRASIYRIEGCADMFCVMCKTAFSWTTGQIITGSFHNPHHAEWLASLKDKHNIDQNVLQCNMHHLYMLDIFKYHGDVKKYINFVMHLRNSERRNYDFNNDHIILEYRVRYLIGSLSKENYNTNMLKLKKGVEYETEIVQMIDSYVELMIGLIYILERSPGRISPTVKERATENNIPIRDTPDDGYTYEMFFQHAKQFTTEFHQTNTAINKKYDRKRINLFDEVVNMKAMVSINNIRNDPQFIDQVKFQKMNTISIGISNGGCYQDREVYVTLMHQLRDTNELYNIPIPELNGPEKAFIQVLYIMEKYDVSEADARKMRRRAKGKPRLAELLDASTK